MSFYQNQIWKSLRSFLRDSGLYVALINGFPYGWFHERRLKDQVFAPDWHTEERVSYTLRLIEILRRLLPEELDGGDKHVSALL